MPTPYSSSDLHKVRPRWVWAGLALLLAGLATVSIGLMETSWTVTVPGLVVTALGAGAALFGGLYYDVTGRAATGHVIEDVREGAVVERPGPEARVEDDQAEATSAALDERRRAFLDASVHHPAPPMAPVGAGLVLLVCVWILLAQGALYPDSALGEGHAQLDMAVAIVLALAGLRLLLAGPRLWATVVLVLGGTGLVLFGLLISHRSAVVPVNEIACGVLVLIGAVLSLDRRRFARRT